MGVESSGVWKIYSGVEISLGLGLLSGHLEYKIRAIEIIT